MYWITLLTVLVVMAFLVVIYFKPYEGFDGNQGIRGNNYGMPCQNDNQCTPYFKCRSTGVLKQCV